MKIVSYDKTTGEIMSVFQGVDLNVLKLRETNYIGYTTIQDDVEIATSYISNGIIKSRPQKPFRLARWDGKAWYNPKTTEEEWRTVRTERDALLAKSDWTQLPDVPLVTKETWAAYRQQLRDITNQPDPFNIVWPEPPQ